MKRINIKCSHNTYAEWCNQVDVYLKDKLIANDALYILSTFFCNCVFLVTLNSSKSKYKIIKSKHYEFNFTNMSWL